MTESQQRDALQRKFWDIASDVRGAVDGWDFKQYVLGFIFYKYISDKQVEYAKSQDFTDEDTKKIVSTFHAWKRTSSPRPLGGEGQGEGKVGYHDIPGFCKSATLREIAEHGYVLTPGRYVGAEEVEDVGVPFAEKMRSQTLMRLCA